ncbi:MAG: hypothetical protein MUC44_14540 [Beijerinckiaceae bacterium]|jgi:hypothetical protein|nr:hypothetical protein [Beijerinckiaceae bacterium]
MIATLQAMLREGASTLSDGRLTADRRRSLGLDRDSFGLAIIVSAVVTLAGTVLPEVNGVGLAVSKALGDDEPLLLDAASYAAMGIALAALAGLLVWRGPALAAWLAGRFGGQPDQKAAACWIYLSTLAAVVITLGVIGLDLVGGLLVEAMPGPVAVVSLLVSCAALVVLLALTAMLSGHLLGLSGQFRRLGFTLVWLGLLVLASLAIGLPAYLLFGGSFA